jgi:hypothetical protein
VDIQKEVRRPSADDWSIARNIRELARHGRFGVIITPSPDDPVRWRSLKTGVCWPSLKVRFDPIPVAAGHPFCKGLKSYDGSMQPQFFSTEVLLYGDTSSWWKRDQRQGRRICDQVSDAVQELVDAVRSVRKRDLHEQEIES